jgi:Flp pilus assembly protein TadD
LRSNINLGLFRMIPAEKDARVALSLKPNSHLSYQALGSSLMLQSRYVEAESAYSQSLLLIVVHQDIVESR